MSNTGKYVGAFLAVVVVWLALAFALMRCDGTVARFAEVGEGLAPLGFALTALALIFAFQQQRAQARGARLDKLADAYAEGFERSRQILDKMKQLASEGVLLVRPPQGSARGQDTPEAANRWRSIQAEEPQLRIAFGRMQLFEDNTALLSDVTKIVAALPSPPGKNLGEELKSGFMEALSTEISQRRAEVDLLLPKVTARLRQA